jgi:hypothetical protein
MKEKGDTENFDLHDKQKLQPTSFRQKEKETKQQSDIHLS